MSPGDCDAYMARMQGGAAEVAPLTTGVDLSVRNNTRVMWDDAAEAAALLARVAHRVPPVVSGLHLLGANPRLRLYRYGPGERHGAHWDTVVPFVGGGESRLTLVFYLNDDFDGGETEFSELGQTVTPRRGSALLFQHRVLHAACEVRRGAKFVLRTDLVYGPPGSPRELLMEPGA